MTHDYVVLHRTDSARIARFAEDRAGVENEARTHYRYLAEQFAEMAARREELLRRLIEAYNLDPGFTWEFEYDRYEGCYVLINKGPINEQSSTTTNSGGMAGPVDPGTENPPDGRDGNGEDDGASNAG